MSETAIVGSGFIGRAWAISFARAGCRVTLWDAEREAAPAALSFIEGVARDLDRNDLLGGLSPEDLLARITPTDDFDTAIGGADHVQECTPEDPGIKREIMSRIDAVAGPDCIVASSTSGILPSVFTEHLAGRGRCLVAHPINPPYLIPAVELVPSPWTDDAVMDRADAFFRAAGHAPIRMRRELDGFVMNRLQGALLEEAFRLVADGYATVEDVDVGIRDGLALRWSFMGPFETIDLNAPGGVRDYAERYEPLYRVLFGQMQRRVDWSGELMDRIEGERRDRLAAEDLGDRQVWRDRRLMALAAHKRKSDREFGK